MDEQMGQPRLFYRTGGFVIAIISFKNPGRESNELEHNGFQPVPQPDLIHWIQ